MRAFGKRAERTLARRRPALQYTSFMVLRRWLNDEQAAQFAVHRAAAQAFSVASLREVTSALFDSPALLEILNGAATLDALVVRRGEVLPLPLPHSQGELDAMFAQGAGLVLRRAESSTSTLRTLSTAFADEFSRRVHIQLFVTPGGTQGFGWHYDDEDVVILQTVGQKDYYFRANTQSLAAKGETPDFTRVRNEKTPLLGCTLHAGDALYLPRGMWHAARAIEDSFSVSLGLLAS